MTADASTRALLAATAALLDQGRGIERLSHLLTAAALLALVAIGFTGVHQPLTVAMLGLSVLAALAQLYFGLRVGFDAALFRGLAADAAATGTLDELDAALTTMGLLPASKVGRPLEQRVAGACRLFYRQAGSLVLQLVLFLLGAIIAALS
jgi:hypothetical protein